MNLLKFQSVIIGIIGTLLLGACGNSDRITNSESATPTNQPSVPTASPATAKKTEGQHGKSHGGTVIETGAYHLEFVSVNEANGAHLDFYLQRGDTHEAISNAKVTALVQLPDGKQKTIPLTYDASGKHYEGMLAEKASGQYQVKVTSDVGGKKVDGRFTFNQ